MKPLIAVKRRLRVMGFTSGSGNTLWRAWELQRQLEQTAEGCPYEIVGIFSDNPDSKAVETAKNCGLPAAAIDIRGFYEERGKALKDRGTRREYDACALGLFEDWEPDVIMLAGYVWAVTEVITDRYFLLNVHPGDLTYTRDGKRVLAGANGIKAAFREQRTSLRASSHIVTGEVDGGPLLLTSPPVPVDYGMHEEEEERFRHYLKLVNEQSRMVGARTLLDLALGNFQVDGEGHYYYRGRPAPKGITLESWEQYKPGCLIDKAPLLKPESIAVLGASAKKGIGRAIVDNLLGQKFGGRIYAVNVRGENVSSVKGYRDISKLPEVPDMAVLAVPSRFVLAMAESCGQAGVKALVCVSAGFKEVGEAGEALEQELLEIVHRYSMCMLGPNCMGVINTDRRVRLNATILANPPSAGNVAMITQSGALGAAFLDFDKTLGIGYSFVLSMGNQADLNVCDLLSLMEADPNTDVIFLYLEEICEPLRFRRVAEKMKKPVVVVKSGRTAAGAAAATSHTGSLAGDDAIVDAMLWQAGVLRASTLEDGFLLTAVLAKTPPLRGRRIGILSNTGGLGILAADALTAKGFTLPPLPEESVSRLTPQLLPEASVRNPMDLVAPAPPEHYAAAAEEMLKTGFCDGLIITCVPAATVDTGSIGEALAPVLKGADIPVLSCFFAPGLGAGGREAMLKTGLPVFDYPEKMADILEYLAEKKPAYACGETETGREMAESRRRAEQIVKKYRGIDGYMEPRDASALLKAYGLRMAKEGYLYLPQEADMAELSFPLAAKIDHPDIIHKSDVGGVRLMIRTGEELHQLAEEWFVKFKGLRGIFLQEQIEGGPEFILGGVKDPAVGHGVLIGMGGTMVDVLRDTAFGHVPVDREFAGEMLRRLKAYPLLQGYRGREGVNLEELKEWILALSNLLEDFPMIGELDINPLIYRREEEQFVGVDARVRLSW